MQNNYLQTFQNGELEEWLSQRNVALKLSEKELYTLLNQSSSKKIAIRGGAYFKISNEFLGSVS